jgi:hypothetical protein
LLYGALAALGAAGIAFDVVVSTTKYPLLQRLFDGDWLIVRNVLYFMFSGITAVFGYLAVHTRNGTPAP